MIDVFEKFEPLLQRASQLKANDAYYYMRTLESAADAEVVVNGKTMINFAGNNYLGLSSHPKVVEAVIETVKKYGLGTGGSRILSGTMDLHEQLEAELAAFKGTDDCVVFSTGYMANVGAVSSVVGRGDIVFLDDKCHASIIDGAMISKTRIVTFLHNDANDLRKKIESFDGIKGKLIATDSVFSMDGDVADLPPIIQIAQEHSARVLVDEAHSTGVLGKRGSGILEYFNLDTGVDIEVGTLSKSLGGLGGYVAGDKRLTTYLKNGARSFLFATSLPAPVIAGARAALKVLIDEPELVQKLWTNINELKSGLKDLGFDMGKSDSAIVPLFIGDETKANTIARFIEQKGIYVNPCAFPAVPKNMAIIRLSVMATHSKTDVEKTLDVFAEIKRKFPN